MYWPNSVRWRAGNGAWGGNASAGFGSNAGGAYATGADEYDVVEIEAPARQSAGKVSTGGGVRVYQAELFIPKFHAKISNTLPSTLF